MGYRSVRDSALKRLHAFIGRGNRSIWKVITMLYLSCEAGTAVVEYALLLALMILLVIVAIALMARPLAMPSHILAYSSQV